MKPKVFVITGPSGVGKGTLIERLLRSRGDIELSISATTREPRPGETNGREYIFIDRPEFQQRVKEGDFLEHACYIGNSYGTPRSEIERRLKVGKNVVLEIELQGASQIRESMPEAIQIFITPPSLDDLRLRLVNRNTDSQEQIEARLKTAQEELERARNFGFDATIVNDSVERAAAELIGAVEERICQKVKK